MNTKIYASYLRVSTQKQGRSQLGLSSQREICNGFIKHNGGTLGQEFVDVESGTHRDRKGLWDAINYCNENNCPLVIATLSRLARDVEFCFKVVNTGIDIHFVDMPQMNTLLLGVFASVAQYERELTSQRTRNALGELKKKGAKLGASNSTYRANYNNKTSEEKVEISKRKGKSKNERHLNSEEILMFKRILRNVFPEYTEQDDMSQWKWSCITTKNGCRQRILSQMKDYREINGKVFLKWNFSDINSVDLQRKLASYIFSVKRSLAKQEGYNNNNIINI